MPKLHPPPEWGWKVVKYRFIERLEKPAAIVARFRQKHRTIGRTWVPVTKCILNYRTSGDPNKREKRGDSRRATPRERKWLKRTLPHNPVQFLDQLQVAFLRKFQWKISQRMLSQALKTRGLPGDMDDLPLSMKKVERIARQRNARKRSRFLERAVRGLFAEQLVWLDESSMADRASMSRLGWAPVGQPAKLAEMFRSDGRLWSLLAACGVCWRVSSCRRARWSKAG